MKKLGKRNSYNELNTLEAFAACWCICSGNCQCYSDAEAYYNFHDTRYNTDMDVFNANNPL